MTRRTIARMTTLGATAATVAAVMALAALESSVAGEPPVLAQNAAAKAAPAPKAVAVKKQANAAVARDVVAAKAVRVVNNNAQVQQYLQQIRPILRAEYHVVLVACHLSPEQRKEVARAGEQALRQAARKYTEMLRRPLAPAQRAALDPRKQIREGLARAVKDRLSAELAARYQQEIAQREASLKQVGVRNLVARLDRDLVLSPDQRGKIAESLSAHWDHTWCQSLEMFMYDYQFLPPIPDQYVAPFLNNGQKTIWRGIQKVHGFWGGFGMMGGIMANDPLEDDELRLAREEADKDDPQLKAPQPDVMRQRAVLNGQVIIQTRPMAVMKKAAAPPAAKDLPATRPAKEVAAPK